jgi:uncharacterized protein (DUF58 family)
MLRGLYIGNRFFVAAGTLAGLFVVSFIFGGGLWLPQILFYVWLGTVVTDLILLYRVRRGFSGTRVTPERLSNGDENDILLELHNHYAFPVNLQVIDEIPFQFQRRDLHFDLILGPHQQHKMVYTLRPVKRGEYSFGSLRIFVQSPLGLIVRRFSFSTDAMVPVYPSYLQMRHYELLAIHNRLTHSGIKKIRKIGQNREFELIKEYISGDDIRTINWKATARRSRLMVNQYQDERAQQVYSLIDKGRLMQMPFEGMSLLDYAINACLVISNIAIRKFDRAGLITFQDTVGATLPAGNRNNQMALIQEILYHQKTAYRESDFSRLLTHVRARINQRSLLLLFTNFESLSSVKRQLPYLQSMARRHLVVVIFFENTEIKSLLDEPAGDLRAVYHKAIAEKLNFEKRLVVKELQKHGIHALLTPPDRLTVNTINKYLELKARNLL